MKLVIPKSLDLNGDPNLPQGLKSFHVCDKTFIVDGPSNILQKYLDSEDCLLYRNSQFPECKWVTDYKYLGDFLINTHVRFDLGLKKKGYTYEIQSELPRGLLFQDGFLEGICNTETDIIDIKIVARHTEESEESRVFQIRFFSNVNSAKSFTDDNYLKYGYGSNLVDYDTNSIYFRLFNSSTRDLLPPFEEAILAAKKIAALAKNQTIFLFVSGGVDSQCMTQAFVAAKVPFKAVLMVDSSSCNDADVLSARRFFAHIKQPLLEFEIDFVAYIKNYSYVESALTYRFNNPEYGILLSLMERFDGFPVYAGRPVSVSTSLEGHKVIGLAVDETWSRARFLERTRRSGCPEFMIYTIELLEACLSLPSAQSYSVGNKWEYDQKMILLKEAGFDISMAPPVKYTGFEPLYYKFPHDDFGSTLWTDHRGPLKFRFPNGPLRNAVGTEKGRIINNSPLFLKTYEDGFANRYLEKNSILSYH